MADTSKPQFSLSDFDDIRPFAEGEMKEAFDSMLADRKFSHILKGMVPWMPVGLRNSMLRMLFVGIKTPQDFQIRYMKHMVWYCLKKCSTGWSWNFDSSLKRDGAYKLIRFLQNDGKAQLPVFLLIRSYQFFRIIFC